MAWRDRLRWLERGALIIGLLCLGLWARAQLSSWAFQATEQRKLVTAARAAEPERSTGKDSATATPGPRAADTAKKSRKPEAVLGRIEIPRLRIQAVVAEGTDARTLELAVGHIPSTASPGSPGNCGLAGHRDTFFRGLGSVRADDVIRFVTPERTYTYQVEWSKVVEPDRVDTLDPTRAPSMTLVTCYPFSYVGRAPKRFVVRARQLRDPSAPVATQTAVTLASPVLMAEGR